MPKIAVEIEYDSPNDPYWMNPDNVKICLQETCKNTEFNVDWAEKGDPWNLKFMNNVKLVKIFLNDSVASTDGSGLYTKKIVKDIPIKLEAELRINNGVLGVLNVYFRPEDWNPKVDNLIYTDKKFQSCINKILKGMGYRETIEYSEQGMQGSNYVNFDLPQSFITVLMQQYIDLFENNNEQLKLIKQRKEVELSELQLENLRQKDLIEKLRIKRNEMISK